FLTMPSNWLLFVSLFLLTTSTGFSLASIQPRIFGGRQTMNSAIGGVGVQIFYRDHLACTGTLITSRHLITAAHCFENMDQADFHVVAGMTPEFRSHNRSEYKKNGMVEVRLHPNFNKTEFIGDIAVIKTQYPLRGPTIGYAKLCGFPLYDGDKIKVAGWGTTGMSRSPGERNYLQTMEIYIVGHDKCEKKLGRKMPPNVLCAGRSNHRTLCNGDSGGPLLWQDEVCGIGTWTWKCGDNEQKPNVFMSIRYYAKFIKDTIKLM
ncbi:hypothetical protein KR032_006103, partial [Drosophila birchii]